MVSFFVGCWASLFSLINPLSALPVFISLTASHDSKWKNLQIRKACLYIIIICVISYLIGTYVLSFFGISINALRIAGGIIIARSGFLLLNPKYKTDVDKKMKQESLLKEDIAFSPLAMPLLAGPGCMSYLINLSAEPFDSEKKFIVISSIVAAAICIYVIFSIAPLIIKRTGQAGLASLSKIMGFLVLAIGVEMIAGSIGNLMKIYLQK
jgi:multiple antibiotic resistance protein